MPSPSQRHLVTVCQHRSCQRNGSEAVLAEFQKHGAPNLMVSGSECQGQCGCGPTVRVMSDNTWYCQVKPADVSTIVEEHLQGGKPVERLLHPRLHPRKDAYESLAAYYASLAPEES
ncbi:(2Fe-2S) ferredoxin domain-containing protein [Leptolyngbya sp. PCC 6406]|uniref:(2Fe-2S) ferredoxin domain-containing protein n=1 Tax=Leptolyngbya sp. PCC 6406 TaxID=1173264 RepID=UPI0002ACBFAB|nr:(2Fe-2S) ferredoxin domain-containing protein [Leptolyngbya sp. PCC 6406]